VWKNEGEAAGDQPDRTEIGPEHPEADAAHAETMRAQADAVRAQGDVMKAQAETIMAQAANVPAPSATVPVEAETVRVHAEAVVTEADSGVAQAEAVLEHAEALKAEAESVLPQPKTAVAPAICNAEEADPDGEARFRIFVIDTGWNSHARKVLHENFALIRDLNREDPIYFLDRDTSVALLRRHRSLVGRDPIILVQDMRAARSGDAGDLPGFRLHLGLLRDKNTALAALQMFARFMSMNRSAKDLEAVVRRKLRMEGFSGAIEIIGGSTVTELIRI
jgi:hypothetical protein